MFLYYMNVSDLNFEDLKNFVSEDRLEYSKKYFNQKDRILSISGEVLLRYILKKIKIYNPIIVNDDYGKPFLKNFPNIYFNISHCGDYVFCGVSNYPIGVDIEYIHEIDLNIAKTQFHPKEYEYVNNSNDKIESFFEIWVLKESYLKMKGIGLSLDLKSFYINIDEDKDNIKLLKFFNDDDYLDNLEGNNKSSNKTKSFFNETNNKIKIFNELQNIDKIESIDEIIFKSWNLLDSKKNVYKLGVCSLEKIDELNLIDFKEIYKYLE
ncbi:phosphopantetheinyl transferase [Methanobrevibacter arboriphilus JCM 13429 = DSM 1125]|uniref:Phosphopantetheinyl transferase n=2 Tax=Methanobrevibacter arboriphilus TaxID=39441 RepID=A0A1V6N2P6_METAZ|nr:phosphopantetheinyl transferase [Methanobrevibacter arboriphilus JCM 13429 = DSM 1125]